jgi:hypothetical protein
VYRRPGREGVSENLIPGWQGYGFADSLSQTLGIGGLRCLLGEAVDCDLPPNSQTRIGNPYPLCIACAPPSCSSG